MLLEQPAFRETEETAPSFTRNQRSHQGYRLSGGGASGNKLGLCGCQPPAMSRTAGQEVPRVQRSRLPDLAGSVPREPPAIPGGVRDGAHQPAQERCSGGRSRGPWASSVPHYCERLGAWPAPAVKGHPDSASPMVLPWNEAAMHVDFPGLGPSSQQPWLQSPSARPGFGCAKLLRLPDSKTPGLSHYSRGPWSQGQDLHRPTPRPPAGTWAPPRGYGHQPSCPRASVVGLAGGSVHCTREQSRPEARGSLVPVVVFLQPGWASLPEAFSKAYKAGLVGSGCRVEATTSPFFVFMLSLHQKRALTPLEKGPRAPPKHKEPSRRNRHIEKGALGMQVPR